jgi:uncharacterized membrane protein (GlpM family)
MPVEHGGVDMCILRNPDLGQAGSDWTTHRAGRLLVWLAPLVPTALACAGTPFGGIGDVAPVLGVLALLAYAGYLITLTLASSTIGLARGLRLALACWLGFGLLTTLLYGLASLIRSITV